MALAEEQEQLRARDEWLKRHPGPTNEHGDPMLPDGGVDAL